ncbi:MAG: isoprenyl transferase [Alphaproteobacteria bacterium]|nr:isoprenyl transferase [Alphaproteobacteria bacterium]
MDGNGRWAQKKGLARNMGHKKGAQTVIDITKAVKELGVQYLTLYAFSTENWKRDQEEVAGLMNLLREYLDKNFEELKKNDVRIIFIGQREMLDADIVLKMEKLEQETLNNKSLVLQVALSYGSRLEIVTAAKKIADLVAKKDIMLDDINEEIFSKFLYTSGIPDPDLVIRTSGEQRVSNYLLWQIAYSEFYFTNTLWPDFSKEELSNIIENFKTRERRYGKISS